jgi:hypothetical protein
VVVEVAAVQPPYLLEHKLQLVLLAVGGLLVVEVVLAMPTLKTLLAELARVVQEAQVFFQEALVAQQQVVLAQLFLLVEAVAVVSGDLELLALESPPA